MNALYLCAAIHETQRALIVGLFKAMRGCKPAITRPRLTSASASGEQPHTVFRHNTHLVKPLPSMRITIQQPGSSASSCSNCLTYSYLLFACSHRGHHFGDRPLWEQVTRDP